MNILPLLLRGACVLSPLVSPALQAAQLTANWKLNEPAGTSGAGSVLDSVNGNNGTPGAGVTFGGAGANGATGTAASFAGTGGIDIANSVSLQQNRSFTFSAWAYPTATGGDHRALFTNRDGSPSPNQGFVIYNTPGGQWEFWTANGAAWDIRGGGAVTLNQWTHVAATYDSVTGTKNFYINGSLVSSAAGINMRENRIDPLHIGSGNDDGGSFRWIGGIDDVGLFDAPLSPSQISNVMTNGVSTHSAPLNLSVGKSYSYSRLPQFDGGGFYFDEPHVQATGSFSSGDLSDGLTHSSSNAPTVPNPSTIVSWGGNSVNLDSSIVFDLQAVSTIEQVRIGSFAHAPFASGVPDDVAVSFSNDNTTFTSPVTFNLAAPAFDGHHDFDFAISGTGRYVKFDFNGGALLTGSTPNKWMLDELSVFGQAIPEPGTLSLAALAGLFGLRRRRASAR